MKIKQITAALFLISNTLLAQTVSVKQIEENRSTENGAFSNKCDIELKISGDEARKYKFVKISKINKIIDDQDLDLINEEKLDFDYEEIERAKLEVTTKIPARKAQVIKEFSGELTLFNPSEANGSIIKIANFLSKTTINLLPENAGFKLMFLTKESTEKYLNEQKIKQEEELQKLPEAARKMAAGILEAFSNFTENEADPNEITFLIEGDDSKLINLYLEDAKGKKIKRDRKSQRNDILSYSFDEKISSEFKLVLEIETPASTKNIPFKLINIELP